MEAQMISISIQTIVILVLIGIIIGMIIGITNARPRY